MLLTNKTKATAEGRQKAYIKLECIANNAIFPAGGQCDLCGGHTFNTSDHMSKKTGYTPCAPHKTGVGITTPLELQAIQTRQASFFVSAHAHALSMVGCMGLTSVRLVSCNTSCGNPVQSTASELTTSGGGYIPTLQEAAKWLLPLPSNILKTHLSGALSSLIRLIPVLFTSRHQPNEKRVTVARPAVLLYSLPVFVRGWGMLKRFQITARAVNHQGHVIDNQQNVNATSVNAAIAILKEELIGCGFTQVMIRAVIEVATVH